LPPALGDAAGGFRPLRVSIASRDGNRVSTSMRVAPLGSAAKVTVNCIVGSVSSGLPSPSAKPSSRSRRWGSSTATTFHEPWTFPPSGLVMK
jgi:hypothetical protein